MSKKAIDYIPYCKDQGITYLAGAGKAGETIQHIRAAMPADGIFIFSDYGLQNMANADYSVLVGNITDLADPGKVALADRLIDKITVTGPDTADELDIIICGQVSGQVA
jgi:hypothetical protein